MSQIINGYEVVTFDAEVVGQREHNEMKVFGGEVRQYGNQVHATPIETVNITTTDLFVKLQDGTEQMLDVNGGFPCRAGHRLTISQIRTNGGNWHTAYAYNHAMKHFGLLGTLRRASAPWTFFSFIILSILILGAFEFKQHEFSDGFWLVGIAFALWYVKTQMLDGRVVRAACHRAISEDLGRRGISLSQ